MAQQLVRNLQAAGSHIDIDINNVTMRYAMDVTGLVGFAKDFGTCKTFNDASTDEIFDLLREGKLLMQALAGHCLNPECVASAKTHYLMKHYESWARNSLWVGLQGFVLFRRLSYMNHAMLFN